MDELGVELGYDFLTPESIEEMKKQMETKGIGYIKNFMKSKLDGWKTQPLNCAVTGSSGAGKSSFINTIRGIGAEDEGAAAVDVTECTNIPTSYPDKRNPMLFYWDLPGVGTPNYPKNETYLEKVDFQK